MALAKMAERLKNRKPGILGQEHCFKSAVMLPLVEYRGEVCILFEERSRNLDRQPGEICFPGGKIDPSDTGELEAAVRETSEELGLNQEDIKVIAPLDILVTPFNTIIYPFVCVLKDYSKIKPNDGEVESIFCVPLDFLLSYRSIEKGMSIRLEPPPDYPYELIPHGQNYPFRGGFYPQYFYLWEDRIIWGLTARILYHFIEIIKRND